MTTEPRTLLNGGRSETPARPADAPCWEPKGDELPIEKAALMSTEARKAMIRRHISIADGLAGFNGWT